jgi:20S proteasome subunit alpha 7
VEYANKAVEASGTVVALRCKDGVAFAVEKVITSRLYESGSNKRVHNVDKHIGMVRIYFISFSNITFLGNTGSCRSSR